MIEALVVLTVTAAVGLGFVAAWSRRAFLPRLAAVMISVALIALVGASVAELLGRPKPVRLAWIEHDAAEADVLGARIAEGKAIYLWLGLPGADSPRAYVVPWDLRLAKELQQALENAARHGGQPRVRLPFEPSWERREPKFYALPQPKLPDKPHPPPPLTYERRGAA
jgi:hypothetical protein